MLTVCAQDLCVLLTHTSFSVVVDHTYIYPLFAVSAADGSVVCVFLGALLPQGHAVTRESQMTRREAKFDFDTESLLGFKKPSVLCTNIDFFLLLLLH